eukprot:CAMPEP_0170513452 /NCGR_PEP_ID=MMETSP0208-20121228/67406_1 /TAXON_ID=197538 /ORGANISM="Strombidium inclinatum, Strain S3" /LENGTH=173 /DNA_ID=CAMNT_0010797183 /DNA_START=648 /DNA_END=1169 /DNA_ORIENTATION=-
MDLPPEGLQGVFYRLLHFRKDLSVEINVLVLLEVNSKVFLRNLVAWLILTILLIPVLNGVVRQVDVSILEVREVELVRARSYVRLLVVVTPEVDSIDYLGEAEHSDIELAHGRVVPVDATDQDGAADILLNYPALSGLLLEEPPDFVEVGKDANATPSVRVLARFTNPNLWLV